MPTTIKSIIHSLLTYLHPDRFVLLPRRCKKTIIPNCIIDLENNKENCMFCKKAKPKQTISPLRLIRETMELSTKEMALKLGIHVKSYMIYERMRNLSSNGKPMTKTKNKIIEIFDEWIKTSPYQTEYFHDKFKQMKKNL